MNKQRIIEKIIGSGKVYLGDEYLTDVKYNLVVKQEMIVSRSFSGTQEIPGMKDIEGTISILGNPCNLVGNSIKTLNLQDGREWKFIASSGNPVSGIYRVINASGEGLIDNRK